jgi:hypothetical protein
MIAVSTDKAKNNVTTTQLYEKKLKFIKLKLRIFYFALTYNIFGFFYFVMYLHPLGSDGNKSKLAKFFNKYVNREIQDIRKELIRKRKTSEKIKNIRFIFCALFQFLYYCWILFHMVYTIFK